MDFFNFVENPYMDNRISLHRTRQSRIADVDFDNIPFGKVFADHMFVADFDGQQWKNFEIRPLERLPFHPATMAWHLNTIPISHLR